MSAEKLGRILVSRGLLDERQLASALDHQERRGGRLGDVLVDLGLLDEVTVLKALAEQHGISYVTRKQIAESPISENCLGVVPLAEAERESVFPVWYNPSSGEFVVVVSDPTRGEVVEAIRRRAKVQIVTIIVALPSTVQAAIDRHYKNVVDAFERAPDDSQSVAKVIVPPAATASGAYQKEAWENDVRRLARIRGGRAGAGGNRAPRRNVVLLEPQASQSQGVAAFLRSEGFQVTTIASRKDLGRVLTEREADAVLVRQEVAEPEEAELVAQVAQLAPRARLRRVEGWGAALVDDGSRFRQLLDATFETLDLLLRMSGLEMSHAQAGPTLPKVARQVGQHLGLGEQQLDELTIAAYMRELARDELTIPTVLECTSALDPAEVVEQLRIPVKRLAELGIPVQASHVLNHLYERYDGTGMPHGLEGEELPLSARILSAVSSFHHLAGDQFPDERDEAANVFGRLWEGHGSTFDPRVLHALLDVFEKRMLLGEIDIGLQKVLIVDPDPAFSEQLGGALLEKGYRVLTCSGLARAREMARDYGPDVIVSEVHLPDGHGFELLQASPDEDAPAHAEVFVTSEQDQSLMSEALERGAEDYVLKIVGLKVVQAKIERVLERVARDRTHQERAHQGVSGRLSEMGLTDIIQVLGTSGKTARVVLSTAGDQGEIWVREGDIVHAAHGPKEGEDAFYDLITWAEGDFRIETVREIARETIQGNYEMLMLEGLRRMDEAGAAEETGTDGP